MAKHTIKRQKLTSRLKNIQLPVVYKGHTIDSKIKICFKDGRRVTKEIPIKRTTTAMLTLEKIDFKTKIVTREKRHL